MALKHAILSCLSRGVPLSGYKLNTVFSDQNERVWNASPSQVYSELTKMEAAGLIQVAEQTSRKTMYRITESGTEELRHWLKLSEPDHTIRDDSLLRLMTLWVLDGDDATQLIDAEIAFQQRRRNQLEHTIAGYSSGRENAPVWRNRLATHILWVQQTDVLITWLQGLRVILADQSANVGDVLGYPVDALQEAAVE